MNKDVVELEMGEDGVYSPKDEEVKENKKKEITKKAYGYNKDFNDKPKIFKENHADEFLSGVDAGLDFIEKVVPRVEKLLRLRG